MLNPNIFRAYDIRGIAHIPKTSKKPDLTPQNMELIGRAAGSYLKQLHGKNLVLGRDCRLSNPQLSDAFIKGLLSTGCNVTDMGMIPTPLMYWAVCHYDFNGGACITASHNPKEYNGVKLVGEKAHSICGEDLQEVYQKAIKGDFEKGDGVYKKADLFNEYMHHISELINLKRSLKVIVDAGNGATGPYVKEFFEKLGCEVITLYSTPDGAFPNHPANPEEIENMQDLINAVQKHKADIGIAFDGDGDRVGVVDENGKHYNADWLLILLARDLLRRKKGAKIVFDVKVSQLLIEDIKKHGGEPVMCKTGHSFIERKMHEIGAPLGGEISGHMFFSENYYGFDDAFLAAAKILEILSGSDKAFSAHFSDLHPTICTPELKSACPDDLKFEIVERISTNFVNKYDCITIDGVRVNFDESSWGAVRCSNTSPNLTIRFESPSKERLYEIMQIMLRELEKYPEVDLWWSKEYGIK